MAFELNRPDIRRAGINADADEEDDAEDADATGANGLAPGVDDRLVLLPPGDVCALTGGDSGDVDGKLKNALVCDVVTPDDPLPDAVSTGDSVLAPPMPPGDACFDGAEKALGEDRLDDPLPPLAGCPDTAIGVAIAPCGEWNKGAAVPCADDELAEGE